MKFIQDILNIFSSSPEIYTPGEMVDVNDCYALFDIRNSKELFKTIITLVPDDSILAIEGIYSKNIIDLLLKEEVSDNQKVYIVIAWPRQIRLKSRLNSKQKSLILNHCDNWDFGNDIIHQHIYKDNHFYFTSYANMKSGCVFISHLINKPKIEKLKFDGIIGNYDEYP